MRSTQIALFDDDGRRRHQLNKVIRARSRAEVALGRHGTDAWLRSEIDRIDSQTTADAFDTALTEEMDLLDHGMARAGQSAAKIELVARKVEAFSAINNRRLSRRFGV